MKHRAGSTDRFSVAKIRTRLQLERNLPKWEKPTPETLFRYYGIRS